MAAPRVTINECLVLGKAQPPSARCPKPIEIFYNIPYATAERFQPAALLPPAPSTTINAQKVGPSVPNPFARQPQVESPLYLHIFRPVLERSDGDRKLPVVVYIHGGAFNSGHPLDGHAADLFIANGPEDMIAVGISYRIGALGFLAGGEQVKEMNLGLRDQKVAVEWVKEWIGGFGGDAERITLRGLSAGAHSIGHHILNPKPIGITKIILESGSPTARSVLSPSNPRSIEQFRAFKALTKNTPLDSMKIDLLVNHSVDLFSQHMFSMTWPQQPVIDGGPDGAIADLPLNLWADFIQNGRAKDVSIITGFCSYEGATFIQPRNPGKVSFRDYFANLIPAFSSDDLDELEKLYPDPATETSSPYANHPHGGPSPGEKQWIRLSDAYGQYAYICPILHTAQVLASAGARVYLYEYASKSAQLKIAAHCTQGAAVEHDINEKKVGMKKVADEMNRRWHKFVAADDGDLGDLWTPFTGLEKGGKVMVFGEGNDEECGGSNQGVAVKERVVTEREKEVCRFWWQRMELSQGMGERGATRATF